MSDSKAVGCWGVIVGVMAALVLLWLTLDLLSMTFVGLTGEAPGSLLTDPGYHHQLGQYLIVVALVAGVFTAVFRPDRTAKFVATARYLFWAGAGLNLLAWLQIPGGVRWATWALILAILGAAGPFLVAAIARSSRPAPPPGPAGPPGIS
jgi:hypothetical protein